MRKFCRACALIAVAISEPCLHAFGMPHVEGAATMLMPFLDKE